MCPTKWFTPIIGIFRATAMAFAIVTPSTRVTAKPGVDVTATALRSLK